MRFLDFILLALTALALMQVFHRKRPRPPFDPHEYKCPVCGEPGYTFMRCNYPGCADGR